MAKSTKKMTAKGTGKGARKPAAKAARKPAGAMALGNQPSKAEVKEVKAAPAPEKAKKREMKDVTLHSVTSSDGKLSLMVKKLNENPPRLDIVRHGKNNKDRVMRVANSIEALGWLTANLPTAEPFMESADKPKAEKPAKAQKKTAPKVKAKGKKAAPVTKPADGLDIDDLLG